jgi:hypothetical protein
MGHKGYVAGGCFKNIFNKEKIKDLDIFFRNEEEYQLADLYFREHEDYKFAYASKKVRAYKNLKTDIVVELIHSHYGEPIEMIERFDFTIAKFVYYKKTIADGEEERIETVITHHKDFFEHLFLKRLVIENTSNFPINIFERSLKYTKYGYNLCKESKVKLLEAIKATDNIEEGIGVSLYNGLD